MKRKFLTARNCIAAFLGILLCVCLAFCVWSTVPRSAFAEEAANEQTGEEQTPETPEEDERLKNVWQETPYISSWVYRGYNKSINVVLGKSEYGEVLFSVLNYDESEIDAILSNFKLENGTVPKTVSDKLATLGATKAGYEYILRATVKDTEEYTGLEKDAKFGVLKATNSWLVAPAVLSWKYGEYDGAVNVINAVPAFGKESTQILIFGDDNSLKCNFNLNADGSMPEQASTTLSTLDAGDYYLLATVKGNDNYTSLNDGVANPKRDGVKFSVFRVNNSWKTTPNVIQWNWGSYDRTKNLITAVPNYPSDPSLVNVTYGVYTDASCYSDYAVKGLEEFTAVAGIVENSVARVLARLDAGTYYLFASSQGNGNYTTLNSTIQFTVQSVRNSWKTTPNIVQWTRGEYDPDKNVITAEPVNGEIENVVFGIYSDAACNNILGESFSYIKERQPVYGDDGNLEFSVKYYFDDKVYDRFDGLNAGSYYLKIELAADEDGNYAKLTSVVQFTVQSVQNHWITTPSAVGWKYGEYNQTDNKIHANPAWGNADISIYDVDGEAVLFDNGGEIVSFFNFDKDGAVPEYAESVLKTLGVGTYYLLASVPADQDGNYSGLNNYTSVEQIKAHGIEFTVSAVQNGWVTIPKILSWSEGHYDGEVNKIIAEARNGNDKMVVYVFDGEGRIVTSNSGGNELDYEAISSLPVGSYTLKFEIQGTDNYTGLEGETTFAVFEDSVGLGGIIASVIVFAVLDVFAAAACIVLMIFRRKKIEDAYRTMIRKELNRR